VLPFFDLQGGLAIVVVRAVMVTAVLSVFGTMVFRTIVAPKVFARMDAAEIADAKRQMLILAQASVAAALIGACLWLVTQAATMADAESVQEALAAVPKVLSDTIFGHVIALQMAALLILALTLGIRDRTWRARAALVVAIVAVALQAGHSHAFSMVEGPSVLLGCDILHLLGAGAWLGGLIPLLMIVRFAAPNAGATAARWFSPLGQWCIAALVVSAAWQAWILVATIPGLIGTAYGWMILVKFALFGVLLGFAYYNRYRFAPALLHGTPDAARRTLIRSIMLQTGCAAAILVAAVVLSELPPAMHTQPLWPFNERLSLTAINEDPDFRWEVIEAVAALAGAAVLLVAAGFLRRFRLAYIAAACVIGWFALPHMDLLLVPAYPTSFYHSPTGFASASIVQGDALFARNCAACHGQGGHGDGPLAKTLPIPPADLTAAHLWMHSDGELFWWISHGMPNPEGGQAMPGFATTLDEDSRWDLIDYIRAHNAGLTLGADGHWSRIVPAPAFAATCEGGETRQLADFAGAPLLLAIGTQPSPQPGTQMVVTGDTVQPSQGVCAAHDLQIGRAYAIAAGLPGDAAGWIFLIDAEGLLRRAWGLGHAPDEASLTASLADVRKHSVQTAMQSAAGMEMQGMDMSGMSMKMTQAPRSPGPGPNAGSTKAVGSKTDGMKMDGMKM
jgi:putative copper export protein/mono/diheme cytochrome c family protein